MLFSLSFNQDPGNGRGSGRDARPTGERRSPTRPTGARGVLARITGARGGGRRATLPPYEEAPAAAAAAERAIDRAIDRDTPVQSAGAADAPRGPQEAGGLLAHAPGEGRPVRPVALTHDFERRIDRVACCSTELDLARCKYALALIRARIDGFQYELVSTDTLALEEESSLPRMLGPRARIRAEYQLLFRAIMRGRIDLIVASFPDLEPGLDRRLDIAAVLPRLDARDALVLPRGGSFTTLAAGARIGLSGRRQELQLLHLRPDLMPQRVATPLTATLQRVVDQDIDGAIVAACDLRHGDLERFRDRLSFLPFSLDAMTPQPGQGQVVLLTLRSEQALTQMLNQAIDDAPSRHALEAETLAAFALGYGSADADPPSAAYVSIEDGQLMLLAMNAGADRGTPQTTKRPIAARGSLEADPNLIRACVQSLLGHVAFVGAGPGSPDLMTIRGRRLLAEADVIFHDRASAPSVLPYASQTAEQIYLDARTTPAEVARRLIEQARLGRRIVRLMGGDPFLFDPGAAEALALNEAGIAYEIVPGVSSALAAPAFAGIPMTAPDWPGDVHLIDASPYVDERPYEARAQNWANLSGTLVLLNVVTHLPEITAGLIAAGMPARSPVALVQDGSLPTQRVIHDSLGQIAAHAVRANILPPASLIIGAVSELGRDLAWWPGHGILTGRTVALIRSRAYAEQGEGARDELELELTAQGARVYELALVTRGSSPRIESHLDETLQARLAERLPSALRRQARSSFLIVLGSPDAALALGASLRRLNVDMRQLANVQFAALSRETAAALATIGLQADYVAGRRGPEELATELANSLSQGDQVLALTGPVSEPVLGVVLQVAGVRYDEVVAYEEATHLPARQALIRMLDDIDYIIFRSALVVEAFVDGLAQNGIRPETFDPQRLVVFAENEEAHSAALVAGLPLRGRPLSWSQADILRQIGEVSRNSQRPAETRRPRRPRDARN